MPWAFSPWGFHPAFMVFKDIIPEFTIITKALDKPRISKEGETLKI